MLNSQANIECKQTEEECVYKYHIRPRQILYFISFSLICYTGINVFIGGKILIEMKMVSKTHTTQRLKIRHTISIDEEKEVEKNGISI